MADETIESQLAASIASAGTPDYKPVEVQPTATEAAPTEDNPETATAETPASTDGQPADASKVQVQPTAEKTETPATAPAKATPDGKTVTTATPAQATVAEPSEDALMREGLGLPKADADTPEAIKARYEASSRESHRLIEEDKAKASALAEAGVEFTRDATGKFVLKANQKYLDSLKDTDLPDVYGKLAAADKELVAEEVAKKIVKMALSEVLPKRPIAKATGQDSVLPREETDRAFDTLSKEKLSNGQPRFPDITEATTMKYMREFYDKASLSGFRSWMNQNPDNFKEGLSLLHASVFRVRAPLLAAKKDAEAAKKQEQDKLKKNPATVTSGAGVKPDAMRHKGTPSGKSNADAIGLKIASAKAA